MPTTARRTLRARTLTVLAVLVACVLLPACSSGQAGTATPGNRTAAATPSTLRDQWGRDVTVPADPQRVVVIEWEGLVVKSMGAFGLADRIVGVDKPTTQQQFRRTIIPALATAKDVGTAFAGLNIEQIAGLKPDVVFLEAWAATDENRALHQQIIDRLDALKIPTVVFLSPSNYAEPDLSTAWEIVEITGKVFGQEKRAAELVSSITTRIDEVKARIPRDGASPEAVIFATTNYVMGRRSIQSAMLTRVLGATNPVGAGTFVPVSEEKLLALDPEALLVIGHEGYVSAEEILAGKNVGLNWSALASMRALKNRRIAVLGYDEWRATAETPVALMKMAKALYPKEFADVDTEKYEIDYYREIYGLDEAGARTAVEGQHFRGKL